MMFFTGSQPKMVSQEGVRCRCVDAMLHPVHGSGGKGRAR